MLPSIRLMQLISPSLPVGAYSYSQGVEWAVECGWISDRETLARWIIDIAHTNLAHMEIPLLYRLYNACEQNDLVALEEWSNYLLACRETAELRLEENNRARALSALLPEIGISVSEERKAILGQCQLAAFAHAAHDWQIPLDEAASGYLWGWLENITLAGIKIIPLGQTAGQKVLAELSPLIPEIVSEGLTVTDDAIGASCTAQAIASSRHETQYTRIYRS